MNLLSKTQCNYGVLLVGETFSASRTAQRAMAMRSLGCRVEPISIQRKGHDYETKPSLGDRIRHKLRLPSDPAMANDNILSSVDCTKDILWMETASMIKSKTLREVKRRYQDIKIICYSEDDMLNRRNCSIWQKQCFPLIDLWVTTKSLNISSAELPSLGVRKTLFVNNSYDPLIHKPVSIAAKDQEIYGAEISFIGTFEKYRANSLLALAENGLEIRVWGNGWNSLKNKHKNLRIEGRPAYNIEFAKVVNASAINLCFLRRSNRDLQTCRSVELPACGGFMIHERNKEIAALLPDGETAIYFSSDLELIKLCRVWLKKERDRQRISRQGRRRVESLRLSHADNIVRVFDELSLT